MVEAIIRSVYTIHESFIEIMFDYGFLCMQKSIKLFELSAARYLRRLRIYNPSI